LSNFESAENVQSSNAAEFKFELRHISNCKLRPFCTVSRFNLILLLSEDEQSMQTLFLITTQRLVSNAVATTTTATNGVARICCEEGQSWTLTMGTHGELQGWVQQLLDD